MFVASVRTLSGYSERHHIVPRCLGGDDAHSNIVHLTPEEHYVAHLLLVKMTNSDYRLLWAAVLMTGGNDNQGKRYNNKIHGWLRREFREMVRVSQTGRKHSESARKKMSTTRRGLKRGPRTAEFKAHMSVVMSGRKRSPEHCLALSIAKTGIKRPPRSE